MSLDRVSSAPVVPGAGQLAVTLGNGRADPHLVVQGELDAATVTVLADPLDAMAQSGATELVVDFREVTFCDLAGLNLLADVGAELRRSGRRLVVYGPCPPLQILLDLVRPAAPVELTPAPAR